MNDLKVLNKLAANDRKRCSRIRQKNKGKCGKEIFGCVNNKAKNHLVILLCQSCEPDILFEKGLLFGYILFGILFVIF